VFHGWPRAAMPSTQAITVKPMLPIATAHPVA
jgi:hypothetical protein